MIVAGVLGLLAVALYIASPPFLRINFRSFSGDESGRRLIYFAQPKIVPCEADKEKQCPSFDKRDAKLRMRLPVDLIKDQPEVTNSLSFMPILVTGTNIQPQKGDRLNSENLIDWHGVHLTLLPSHHQSFFANTLQDHMMTALGSPGLPKGEKYIEAPSFIPGFTMYDVPTCIGYDESQIDKSNPDNAFHPLYKACELRSHFFVPTGRSDLFIYCPRRILFKEKYTNPMCNAISFFKPALVQSYSVKQDLMIDGRLDDVDKRLQAYFLSMIVSN